MSKYEVIVGNVGTVYYGDDEAEANRIYDSYIGYKPWGLNETASVTLMEDGEPIREYRGTLNNE